MSLWRRGLQDPGTHGYGFFDCYLHGHPCMLQMRLEYEPGVPGLDFR
jgi:hypothetical protein